MKKTDRSRRKKNARAPAPITEAQLDTKQMTDLSWIAIILAAAVAVRVVYLWQIASIPLFHNLAGDGRTYDEWAQPLAAGDWLGREVFYQAPLYPYFLGILQSF